MAYIFQMATYTHKSVACLLRPSGFAAVLPAVAPLPWDLVAPAIASAGCFLP